MTELTGLLITVLVAVIYAGLISVGYGKRMDDLIVTRPLVVAGGVLIVIVGKTWGDWQETGEWVVWFGACSVAMWVRSAIFFFKQLDREKVEREEHELELLSLSRTYNGVAMHDEYT